MSEPTLLDALLRIVDGATDAFDRPATLWFADADPTTDPDGITLGCKEVDGHPLPHLLGFVAPPEWTVFGLTTCGWMGDLDAALRPSRQPGRRRVRQTFLVGRSGATAGIVRFEDGGDPITDPPSDGMVHDAVLRCLGLPTQPPERTTAHHFTAQWLGDVVGAGQEAPAPLTWWDVAHLHPAVRLLATDRPVGRVPPSELVRLGRAMSNVCDWSFYRQLAIDGKAPEPEPDVAAWMDDGMLSRWVGGSFDPVPELVPRAEEVVSRSCARRIREVVDRLCPEADLDEWREVG